MYLQVAVIAAIQLLMTVPAQAGYQSPPRVRRIVFCVAALTEPLLVEIGRRQNSPPPDGLGPATTGYDDSWPSHRAMMMNYPGDMMSVFGDDPPLLTSLGRELVGRESIIDYIQAVLLRAQWLQEQVDPNWDVGNRSEVGRDYHIAEITRERSREELLFLGALLKALHGAADARPNVAGPPLRMFTSQDMARILVQRQSVEYDSPHTAQLIQAVHDHLRGDWLNSDQPKIAAVTMGFQKYIHPDSQLPHLRVMAGVRVRNSLHEHSNGALH